jgi:ribosomal protein L37E
MGGRKKEKDMAYCPKCGGKIYNTEKRCSSCGVSAKWIEEHWVMPPPDSLATPSRRYVFCSRCGAAEGGGGIVCIDGNNHTYQSYTHKPVCNSCGIIAGSRGECVLFHQLQHDFV